jgi:hypothetical protein
MIVEIRKAKPFIHFGFNRQTLTSEVSQDVVVWQDTLYNNKEYDLNFMIVNTTDAEIMYKDFNKIILRFTTTGSKSIIIQNGIEKMQSNKLNINII